MPWWVWVLLSWAVVATVAAVWLGGAAALVKREERLDLARATTWEPPDVDRRAVG